MKPTPLFSTSVFPQNEENRLESLLSLFPVDYLSHRAIYTTIDGYRALATIDRDWRGNMTVRRVLPGRFEESTNLRDWLEVAVFLDVLCLDTEWMRDYTEEAQRRKSDRNQLERKNVYDTIPYHG